MSNLGQYAQQAVVPVAIVLVAIAAYTDCRWRIIKNVFTLPAMALGLLLQVLGNGWPGLTAGLLGLGVGFGLMMIPFLLGQMGAGDVKLMAALGALLGAFAALNVFLYTTLAGGVLAVGFALYHRQGANTLRRTWQMIKGLVVFRSLPAVQAEPGGVTMPYGVAIAIGTLTYLVIGNVV